MPYATISAAQKAQYDRDGYLIVKNFLSDEEVKVLYGLATGDDTMKDHAFDLNDQLRHVDEVFERVFQEVTV